jgi:hypothetical protein
MMIMTTTTTTMLILLTKTMNEQLTIFGPGSTLGHNDDCCDACPHQEAQCQTYAQQNGGGRYLA